MNTASSTEDRLRAGLAAAAGTVTEAPFTPADISGSALRHRRRQRGLWAGVAAAVVLAIAVPTAVVGLRDGASSPAPAPAPPRPSPSPLPTPTPVTGSPLNDLPEGAAPQRHYLQDHVLHADGTSRLLPGTRVILAVGRCIEGLLLVVTDERGSCLDDGDRVRQSGETQPMQATSDDGTRTAYVMEDVLHLVADGVDNAGGFVVKHPGEAWPVGFLGDGSLIYMDGLGRTSRFTAAGTVQPIALNIARAVSGAADLIAGADKRGNTRVVDATGRLRWTADWQVVAFDVSGRYAAGMPSEIGGGPSTMSILDAQDGSVLAQAPLGQDGIVGWGDPLLEPDGNLLFVAGDQDGNAAILRLRLDGRLERTTPVLRPTAADQRAYTLGDF